MLLLLLLLLLFLSPITRDILIIILIIATIPSHTFTDSQFTSSTRHPLSLVCFKHSPMQLRKTFPNNAFEIFRLLAVFGNGIIIIITLIITTISTHTTANPYIIPTPPPPPSLTQNVLERAPDPTPNVVAAPQERSASHDAMQDPTASHFRQRDHKMFIGRPRLLEEVRVFETAFL